MVLIVFNLCIVFVDLINEMVRELMMLGLMFVGIVFLNVLVVFVYGMSWFIGVVFYVFYGLLNVMLLFVVIVFFILSVLVCYV